MTHISPIGGVSYQPIQNIKRPDANNSIPANSSKPVLHIDSPKSFNTINQAQANIGIAQVAMQNTSSGSNSGGSSGDIAQSTTGTAG